MTSYDASPKCKINSAFNRKKIAKLYYGLYLTTGGLFLILGTLTLFFKSTLNALFKEVS